MPVTWIFEVLTRILNFSTKRSENFRVLMWNFNCHCKPDFRCALRLCVPALIIGFLLRATLLAYSPIAFVHNDAGTVVETAALLKTNGILAINGKKTFLVPLLYCVPAILGIPILSFAVVVQHFLGLLQILVVGLLCFFWFRHWRILIVPTTILVAVNPTLLWYEHTALPECYAVFGVLLVVLAVTYFFHSPSRSSLIFMLAALFIAAGARPEGRLLCFLVLAATLCAAWPTQRARWFAITAAIVWSIFLLSITSTRQGGTLLLASLLHLAPKTLVISPGVAETLASVQKLAESEWRKPGGPNLVRIRKAVRKTLIIDQRYISISEHQIDKVASRAAIEIALRNFSDLPGLALQKFILGHHEQPVPFFSYYAVEGQLGATFDDDEQPKKILPYAPLVWGMSLQTREEISALLKHFTSPANLEWLSAFQAWCIRTGITPASPAFTAQFSFFPWLYILAILGAISLCMRERPPFGPVFLCTTFLIIFWFIIMITANTRARFRITFEPFWFIYLSAFFDTLIATISRFTGFSFKHSSVDAIAFN